MTVQDIGRLRPNPAIRSTIVGVSLAAIVSAALFAIVMFVFSRADYLQSVDASFGVTTGHPVWKTFQGRVLAPYIIKAMALGSPAHYVAAHMAFQFIAVALAAFLLWRLGRKIGGNEQSGIFALALFVMSFVALLRPPCLYSWDFVDLIVFTLFIDFVLSNRPLSWFIGLFAVATWNRDSANFIALWLMIEPVLRALRQRLKDGVMPALDWWRMLAGVACVAAGLIIAELLRRNLLIEEMAPKYFPDNPVVAGHRYNFVLPINIEYLRHSLFSQTALTVLSFLAITVWLGAAAARRDPQRGLPLFAIELALIAATLGFGIIYEPRVFVPLIPFFVVSAVQMRTAATSPGRISSASSIG